MADLRQERVDKKPERPTAEDQFKFTRQRPVQWFSPKVLLSSAERVVLSSVLGEFLDKREIQQAVVPAEPPLHCTTGGDVWFDFISDTGDGFDPTYSIAWLASQPTLRVDGVPAALPRGQLLVLGGDEVYPIGSPFGYENRFTRPYEAALPYTAENSPTMVAVPGNHDWYDGLTSFMRVFCQQKWVGGRQTKQNRSYFAVKLVADWWLWGIDIQFDTYIDEPQLDYFNKAALLMGEGGRVILCTAKPSWIDVAANQESFRNLAYLESHLIREAGGRLMLSLSGDSHHYAHYEAEDRTHKLTAGGGGAFLHPTHHLDPELDVPDEPNGTVTQCFRLEGRQYPSRDESRRLSKGAVWMLRHNPTFAVLPAALYLLLGVAGQFAVRAQATDRRAVDVARDVGVPDILTNLVTNPFTVLLLLVVVGGLIGFAKPRETMPKGIRRTLVKVAMGLAHALVQIGVGAVLAWVALQLSWPDSEAWFGLVWLGLLVLLGAVVSSLIMGVYLAVCCGMFKAHGNEAFSAMALTRYKNFLRIHISADGVLTVYPIGLDRANDQWRVDGDNPDDEASWLAPVDETALRPRLVDGPIVIDPRSGPPVR